MTIVQMLLKKIDNFNLGVFLKRVWNFGKAKNIETPTQYLGQTASKCK